MKENANAELVFPCWQDRSQLIGYGVFSLVFRPSILIPNSDRFSRLTQQVKRCPDDYVGLITTAERYNNEIRKSLDTLKELRSQIPPLSDRTVLPEVASDQTDFLLLNSRQIDQLAEKNHAVKKKLDYEGSWKSRNLIQMIYPYAGKPLASFSGKQSAGPEWNTFFDGMEQIASSLNFLHKEGFVHGDLSPNNILYDSSSLKFRIVDWNMVCRAEEFLNQKKGETRVGCWSPEHFCLATILLESIERDDHWSIYEEEMLKYTGRLLDFCSISSTQRNLISDYFHRVAFPSGNSVFRQMYNQLQAYSKDHPDWVGKYHDLRYLMDTIVKSVSFLFPLKSESQQNRYRSFLALCLAQNLPQRKMYFEDPELLSRRLSIILHSCKDFTTELANLMETPAIEQELFAYLS